MTQKPEFQIVFEVVLHTQYSFKLLGYIFTIFTDILNYLLLFVVYELTEH